MKNVFKISRLLQFRSLWLALLVIEAAVVFWFSRPWLNGDSNVYLDLAQSLSRGAYGALTPTGFEADALRPPGYPIILWFLMYVLRLPVAGVAALQLAVCILSLGAIDLLLGGHPRVRDWFRGLSLIYPFPLFYSSYMMTEPWVMVCLTVAACLIVASKGQWAALIIAGVLAGYSALLRPDMILLPFAVALAFFVKLRAENGSVLRSIWLSLVPLSVSVAVLTPYAVWNGLNFGRYSPLPMAGAVGSSIYSATWQEKLSVDDIVSIYKGSPTPAAIQSGFYADARAVNRSIGAPEELSPVNPAWYPSRELQIQANLAFGKRGVERIRDDPGAYAMHVFHNIWRLWNTSEYPAAIPQPLQLLLKVISYSIFAFGLLGSVGAIFNLNGLGRWRPAALVMLYPYSVHLWLHTEARYTASVRPLLVLFAALLIASLWRRAEARRGAAGSPSTASGAALAAE